MMNILLDIVDWKTLNANKKQTLIIPHKEVNHYEWP